MSPKLKVRLTLLAGVAIGAVMMLLFLAGNDAQAPLRNYSRLVDSVVYVDDAETPCPMRPMTVAECRVVLKEAR